MLGSSIRSVVPQASYTVRDEDEMVDEETDSFPPMYNPRSGWGGDEKYREEEPEASVPPVAAGSPPLGPRSTQDLIDLEEENRVLRREVARLQQLNEARRKQLQEMQGKLDEAAEWQSVQRGGSVATEATTYRRPAPGGGGAPGRTKTPSPTRAQSQYSHSPERDPQRIARLETLVDRWKQKAFTWEERYGMLVREAAKAEGRGSAAMGEALKLAVSVGGTGLEDQIALEEGVDMLKMELLKAKDTIGTMSSRLKSQPSVQPDSPAPPTPPPASPPREVTPQDPMVCHQCADYRYRLADLNRRIAEDDVVRKAKEEDSASFPYKKLLPGMESLQASMLLALHGRNAAFETLKLSTEYMDNYLTHLGTVPLPSAPPERGLYVCYEDEEMSPGQGL